MYDAFIIGNGPSRLSLNITELKNIGRVYGCNYLYKNFEPHALFAVDKKVTQEIEDSGYPLMNKFYSRYGDQRKGTLIPSIPYANSGALAMHVAADQGFHNIFMIGFDTLDNDGFASNVYPESYIKQNTIFWGPVSNVLMKFNRTLFIRVTDDDRDLFGWRNFKNFKELGVHVFTSQIGIPINNKKGL
jgi:hypothetical protein